jgi:hypothetical protein
MRSMGRVRGWCRLFGLNKMHCHGNLAIAIGATDGWLAGRHIAARIMCCWALELRMPRSLPPRSSWQRGSTIFSRVGALRNWRRRSYWPSPAKDFGDAKLQDRRNFSRTPHASLDRSRTECRDRRHPIEGKIGGPNCCRRLRSCRSLNHGAKVPVSWVSEPDSRYFEPKSPAGGGGADGSSRKSRAF